MGGVEEYLCYSQLKLAVCNEQIYCSQLYRQFAKNRFIAVSFS
jgi:hypothetical protein